jgi:L-ascorbate metabolism protein UlaG (beta-lactamase superfamily)
VALQHLSDPERQHQNLGFIFTVGGLNVLHVGDAGVAGPADYRNLKPVNESIDLALLNCYWLDDENVGAARETIAYLKPKAVVLMHQTAGQLDHYRSLIEKLPDLPPVYLLDTPMETLRFRLVDGRLSADHSPLQSETTPVPLR